jgi:hypothetical protein
MLIRDFTGQEKKIMLVEKIVSRSKDMEGVS